MTVKRILLVGAAGLLLAGCTSSSPNEITGPGAYGSRSSTQMDQPCNQTVGGTCRDSTTARSDSTVDKNK